MSTTFAVKIPESGKTVEIAYRGNGGKMCWTNELACLLPNEIKVIPLDNTSQGISNVGDIREVVEKQNQE